ncbi:MAG: DNA translocase FtsK 4TM domain-containing protein [Acetatifactor sp.]
MTASNGRRSSSSNKGTGKSKNTRTGSRNKKQDAYQAAQDSALFHEIGLIVLFVAMVLLFCCNFGIIGPVGDIISGFMFGVFGLTAYAAPVMLFLAVAFWFANEGNPNAVRKLVAGCVLFFMLGILFDLFAKRTGMMESYSVKEIYESCRDTKSGGGILSGSLSYLLQHYLETIGTVLVVLLCSVISLILLTEKSLLDGMKKGGSRMRELSREDAERRRENARARREEQEELRARREEERRLKAEEKENEKILRMEKKVSGVMLDTTLERPGESHHRDDVHEIMLTEEEAVEEPSEAVQQTVSVEPDFDRVRIRSVHQVTIDDIPEEETVFPEQEIRIHKEGINEEAAPEVSRPKPANRISSKPEIVPPQPEMQKEVLQAEKKIPKKYMFPPLSRLQKGVAAAGDSTRELKETALRLQQTLNTFGVKVTITDISQGPSVTRYELQPEQGVKVSKIVGLADDIKLNLAATDIRIEAPIPGKAAIGIEVPNKENMPVALRDLLESREFKEFPSNIAFAVGKDIAGKVVVADIAKMPHMLIAGATGSGKSVCINTIIMSILYKAHPDDVKLIMVDPKVVELSVYNGIPHLLIPVVTDPKKASAALHWGVSEMEDRYRKFADFNVRDLKGYNKKVESMQENGDENAPAKMPQIVIIVDELADLMMVSPGEVEESICRLAQLARAAGIHLIIATQRPSVDVITGLIKANMPSRVAFAVSSGVDSRTILDMNGAEKLLGKGDMLFYPQGYSKPARIQGAFVSDKEVSDVVDFLKNQTLGNTYAEDIEEKIKTMGTGAGSGSSEGSGNDLDELFEKAGRFIIEKDKASIGMLQRVLKIGFNRAARIMDQLCEYGVVGEEEGTKPRKILMSPEQFEQLIEEIV